MEFVKTNNFPSPHIQRCCCYRDGMETITSLLLCLNRRTQCSSLHSKAMWLIMKAAIVMWLSRLLSSIRDTIILTNHNQPPHVILNLESEMKILVECSRPTSNLAASMELDPRLNWTACVVCTGVQCSTVQYSTVHAICAVLLWLYVPGVGWDWGPSFLAPGSRCRWSRY